MPGAAVTQSVSTAEAVSTADVEGAWIAEAVFAVSAERGGTRYAVRTAVGLDRPVAPLFGEGVDLARPEPWREFFAALGREVNAGASRPAGGGIAGWIGIADGTSVDAAYAAVRAAAAVLPREAIIVVCDADATGGAEGLDDALTLAHWLPFETERWSAEPGMRVLISTRKDDARPTASTAANREERSSGAGADSSPETGIAALFDAALGLPCPADTNFFLLGGSSLLMLRMLREVGERWGVTVTPAEFMLDPTVASLVRRVRAELGESADG